MVTSLAKSMFGLHLVRGPKGLKMCIFKYKTIEM